MLTCLAAAVYFIAYKDILHPSNSQGPIKRVLYLLLRISIDLIISVFWLLAFFLSLFPKKTNFKNLFVTPPYKTWATSVVVAFIEFMLFAASDFMILVCYRMASGPATILLAGNNLTATNHPPADLGTGSVRSAVSGTTTVTMTGNAVEPPSTIDGIELAPRVNVGAPPNRGGEMPSAGLTRSGFNACFPVPYRQYAFNPRRPQFNRFQQAAGLWKTSPQFRIGVVAIGGGITLWIGSNFEKVPVSGRYRFNCVSEEYEAQLGREGYQQVMQEYRGDILSPTDFRHQLVGRVLARLLPNSGLKGDWEYHVIDDPDQVNAFVIPGGKVFVFSGVLPICKNEDGLAAVLGHEIAHNVAHHVQEKASLPYLMTLAIGLVTIFFDNSADLTRFILNFGLDLPNSRAQEREADYLGLPVMMAKSCYNPEEAIELWERVAKAEKSSVPQLLSTHPTDRNRVKQIQAWLPEARQKQTESDCGAVTQFADQFNQSLKFYGGRSVPDMERIDEDFW
ncbi:MAG: hypothetical protein Q9188_002764 [Gyalolechia gomerana]